MRTRNNGNRFIEQYKWTIGVCITVQIGERGIFTDVQIGEGGKQRVKGPGSTRVLGALWCNLSLIFEHYYSKTLTMFS